MKKIKANVKYVLKNKYIHKFEYNNYSFKIKLIIKIIIN